MRTGLLICTLAACVIQEQVVSFSASFKGDIQQLVDSVVNILIIDKDAEYSDNKSVNGTGFIVDDSGYIVTNCHVIEGAEKIKIVTSDGNEYYARIIGKDDHSDIALLKIDIDPGIKLTHVTFSNSDEIKLCDRVIVIGNSLGLSNTVTEGIVSYKNRDLSTQISELGGTGDLVSYIQLNAIIQPGDSGGPVFDTQGRVIGMIRVFVSDGYYHTGISFAIPANIIQKIVKQLRLYGKIQRSRTGITVTRMSHEAARILLQNNVGYSISEITDNSPAASAGFEEGDIILTIDGEPVLENTNVEYVLNNLSIGKSVVIEVLRNNQKKPITIVPEACSDENMMIDIDEELKTPIIHHEKIEGLDLGLTNLTPEVREILNSIDSKEEGVYVSYVGPSLRLIMNAGCVIKKVNEQNIRNLDNLKSAFQNITDKSDTQSGKVVFYIIDPSDRCKSSYVVVPWRLVNKVNAKSIIGAKTN